MLPATDWKISTYVKHRINDNNRNWLGVFCGETGSGKTYSSLRLAQNIDDSFNIKKVVFNMQEFMALLNSGTLKKGDCIVFDEAGVGIPAREWYTISNKAIGYLLQTFRNMNLAVIFTVPNISYIDGQARGLFHNYFETKKILKTKGQVRTKIFNIKTDPRTGKSYFIYPKIKTANGSYQIKEIYISLPSQDLVNQYEQKKWGYCLELNKDLQNRIDNFEKQTSQGRHKKIGAKQLSFIVGLGTQGTKQEKIVELYNKKFNSTVSQPYVSTILRRAGIRNNKK